MIKNDTQNIKISIEPLPSKGRVRIRIEIAKTKDIKGRGVMGEAIPTCNYNYVMLPINFNITNFLGDSWQNVTMFRNWCDHK